MTNEQALRVDIVSDVMCPWCIVGYKQLEQAANEAGVELEPHWHPFELNPNMDDAGEDIGAHLAKKYGTTPEGSLSARARLTSLGSELGFTFNFTDNMRMYPTFRAHQLLHWADTVGADTVGADTIGSKHGLKMALFEAHFTHSRNVNDPDTLADVAASVGLDRAEALAVVNDGRFAAAVRSEQEQWLNRGIQGVPALVFNDRQLVQGAQGVDTFRRLLDEIVDARAA